MGRELRLQQGLETAAILERGDYVASSGERIDLRDALMSSRSRSHLVLPEQHLAAAISRFSSTQLSVANETTLAAARRYVASGEHVVALNFASAKNPGGGWISGAQAQEEHLARSSGLYYCIKDSPYYAFHRAQSDLHYSHRAIYSPDVPVFRGDDGSLLPQPWACSFVTCPAPNRGALMQQGKDVTAVKETMRQRIERVLGIMAAEGHTTLMLGAWGCGVFRCDPGEVAELFLGALEGPFRGVFSRAHFAVLDREKGGACIGAFRAAFGESR